MFYKIYKNKSPFYLFNLIPEKTSSYARRNVDCIPLIKVKHNFFKNTFFPSAIIGNKLDPAIRNAKSFGIFKSNILKFVGPKARVTKCKLEICDAISAVSRRIYVPLN